MEIVRIYDDGAKRYFNAEMILHRDDGPAIIYPSGTMYWVRNGRLSSDHGYIGKSNDGAVEWEIKTGRLDGPSITNPNGNNTWALNGENIWPELG